MDLFCLKTPTNNLPPTVSSHSSCVSTGVKRQKREADHYFQRVLKSTMRQFVPPGLLEVFNYWCSVTVTAIHVPCIVLLSSFVTVTNIKRQIRVVVEFEDDV